MSEKEKMMAGLPYNAADKTLVALRTAAKSLCHRYNQLAPTDEAGRRTLLRQILGSVKGTALIEPSFWCDYGSNISVGENFYANHRLVILDGAPVRFGDNVLIGPQCGFYTAGHALDIVRRRNGEEFARPISVGNDVWIGGHVSILPGVTIGDGSVIGSGSVVTRDIPPRVIAVGNPCRPIRPIEEEA